MNTNVEFEASIVVGNAGVLAGQLPRKQLRLVQAWIGLQHDRFALCTAPCVYFPNA